MSERRPGMQVGDTHLGPEEKDPHIFERFKNISSEEVVDLFRDVMEDPDVGITVVPVEEGKETNLYAALVPRHVGAHVHQQGGEWYRIIQGRGQMHIGETTVHDDGTADVTWGEPIEADAAKNSTFVINGGQAHCLENLGGESEQIILIFACGPSHMKNTGTEGGDRIFVDDPSHLIDA